MTDKGRLHSDKNQMKNEAVDQKLYLAKLRIGTMSLDLYELKADDRCFHLGKLRRFCPDFDLGCSSKYSHQ